MDFISGFDSDTPLVELSVASGVDFDSSTSSAGDVEESDLVGSLLVFVFGVLVNTCGAGIVVPVASLEDLGRPGGSFLLTNGASSEPELDGAEPTGARSDNLTRFSSNSVT